MLFKNLVSMSAKRVLKSQPNVAGASFEWIKWGVNYFRGKSHHPWKYYANEAKPFLTLCHHLMKALLGVQLWVFFCSNMCT